MIALDELRVAVVGLGYVGLPLAVEFGRLRSTLGFDIDQKRVEELRDGQDRTLEVSAQELTAAGHLRFSYDAADLRQCNCFIVTVPTPIDEHKTPDLTPLTRASQMLSTVLSDGDIVIYESTVYPGATEEHCVPILENGSGLRLNEGFFVGYSPERINPGDKQHRLPNIMKVTSGSNEDCATLIDNLYSTIIRAGTHKAKSIRVAEAAKVIENTQRDLNIALVNELAMIFARLGIDTEAVLEAAGTKWNFLPFRPGLVGGHCIGVDPFYLTHKAQAIGYHPEIILAGRRMNDGMSGFVVSRLVKEMTNRCIQVNGARVLMLGLSFKENCPDIRNSKIVDVLSELGEYNCNVDVHDPWVDHQDAKQEYGVDLVTLPDTPTYDAIIIGVAHDEFRAIGAAGLRALCNENHVLFDMKYVFRPDETDLRL